MKRSFAFIFVAFVISFGGCSKHESSSSGGHAHRAPHGGTLVELGQHAYNLEFVHDAAAGKLTAYLLDGHAENFVRVALPAIQIVVASGAVKNSLSLRAVANSATGETVGNTSQFEGEAEWLKGTPVLVGTVSSIEIRGAKFDNVAFHLHK